jgi:hypothetical protein
MNRREFLTTSLAATAVLLAPGVEAAEEVRLTSWELVKIPWLPQKLKAMLKLTAPMNFR